MFREIGIFTFSIIFYAGSSFSYVEITRDIKIQAPKNLYKGSLKKKFEDPILEDLYSLKWAFLKKDYKACYAKTFQLEKKRILFAPWMSVFKMSCARGLKDLSLLRKEVRRVQMHPDWLVFGGHKNRLKKEYIESLFFLFKKEDQKESVLKWLRKEKEHMDLEDRSHFHELQAFSYLEKGKKSLAEKEFEESLSHKPSRRVKNQLAKLRRGMEKKEKAVKKKISYQEKKIKETLLKAIGRKDWTSVIKSGQSLLSRFPEGKNSQWAYKKISKACFKFLSKGKKEIPSKARSHLKKLPFKYTYELLESFFKYGFYKEIIQVFPKESQISHHKEDSLWILSRSYFYLGEYKKSRILLEKLVKEHPFSKRRLRYLLKSSYALIRLGKYSKALKELEAVSSASVSNDGTLLSSLYWTFRLKELLGYRSKRKVYYRLKEVFPLTYYALKLEKEKEGKIVIPKRSPRGKEKVIFKGEQARAWDKIRYFLNAGWKDEAKEELLTLNPEKLEEKFIFMKLFSHLPYYQKVFSLMTEILDENPQYFSLELLKIGYPTDFDIWINKQSKKYGLKPSLVFSLIRQESSFDEKAKSPSGARGLMQLMIPTAKEMAGYLRWKRFRSLELYDPQKNISLGTYYLHRLIRTFHQMTSVALASYNVGYGRITKWMKKREDVHRHRLKQSEGQWFSDLWIEELPWSETRFYVKSVLRNQMIYSLLLKSSKNPSN